MATIAYQPLVDDYTTFLAYDFADKSKRLVIKESKLNGEKQVFLVAIDRKELPHSAKRTI